MSNVQLGYTHIIDPISFKSIPSGKIYIGEYGTLPNPANAGTWKQAYFVNSDGTRTAASQPISTNAAGYAVDGSGNIKSVQVDGQYSILVQSSLNVTKFSLAKPAPLASDYQIESSLGRTQADKNAEFRSVYDVIPVAEHAAIKNGTSTYDCADVINAAWADGGFWLVPPGEFKTSKALLPKTGSRILFTGGQFVATGIIITDECVIKIVNASDIDIWNPSVDGGNFAANSGIIVRENTSDIRIFYVKAQNCLWDAIRGGGRAVIVEANTGTVGKIEVHGIKALNCDTAWAVNGYSGSRKNGIIATNIVGFNVKKLIALFGNGTGYPHSGDSQQCIVTNAVGYNVTDPIRFDRGANAIISNVYTYNTTLIDSVIKGTANNVTCTNIVHEGPVSSLYNGSPWDDSGASVDLGFDTQNCHFQIAHKGTAADVLIAGITRSTLVSKTTFDLRTDVVTNNVVSNTQFRANNSAHIDMYNAANNATIHGYANSIGATTLSSKANNEYFANSDFPNGTFTPVVEGTTSAGTATYSVQSGSFTKIGNRVFFNLYLTWSGHTGTGNMIITGLPFTSSAAANSQAAVAAAFVNNITLTASNLLQGYVDVNSQKIVLVQSAVGGGAVANVALDAAGSIMLSGNYSV